MFTYHPDRRLNQMRASNSSGVVFDYQLSQYDDNNNVTMITDLGNGGQLQCFEYDDLDRLTRAFTTGDTGCVSPDPGVGAAPYYQTFTYDPIGNLKTRSDITGNYSYGSSRPHAVTRIGSTHSFGYDGNGNMISRTVPGVSQGLSFGAENRLETVTEGTTSTSFIYDADGNRVLKVVDDLEYPGMST